MNEITLSLDHPILFVEDFSNPALRVPEYSSGSIASATPSCISIRVVTYIDGEVLVRLVGNEPPPLTHSLVNVFNGTIHTPGKKVAVVTSENERVLEVNVSGEATQIKVSVNDTQFPTEVQIEAN
jgi:hypothetical protein